MTKKSLTVLLKNKRTRTYLACGLLILGVLFLGLGLKLYSQSYQDIVASQKLSEQELAQFKANLLTIFDDKGPTETFDYLTRQIEQNPSLARDCHKLLHAVGHQAYKKYGSFTGSIKYQTGLCNSGYTHGIIEATFVKQADINLAVNNTCPVSKDNFDSWQCYHGIGHGVMYATKTNLNKSLDLCNILPTDFTKSACINGAYMDYFITTTHDGKPKTINLVEQNFCQTQPAPYKGDCYFYAPSAYLDKNVNNFTGVINWCEQMEQTAINTCISGVGSQIMKENITQPAVVKQVCAGLTGVSQKSCYMGAIGIYINHYGNIEAGKKLCAGEFQSIKSFCESAVASRQVLFN